jgi:hypothetical protein
LNIASPVSERKTRSIGMGALSIVVRVPVFDLL